MEKFKFNFVVKAAGEGKTNVIALTSIERQENKNFIMAVQYQSLHTILEKTEAYGRIKNTLKKKAPEERNMDNSYERFKKDLSR